MKRLVLCLLRNKCKIVHEVPDNPVAGLVGTCACQDNHTCSMKF